jgi:hypothetical protein
MSEHPPETDHSEATTGPLASDTAPAHLPREVKIAALVFCLGGAVSLWSLLVELSHGRVVPNFGVLALPIGVGLLRGWRPSVYAARMSVLAGYLIFGLYAVALLVKAPAPWRSGSLWLCVGFLLALRVVQYLLYRPAAEAWLHGPRR